MSKDDDPMESIAKRLGISLETLHEMDDIADGRATKTGRSAAQKLRERQEYPDREWIIKVVMIRAKKYDPEKLPGGGNKIGEVPVEGRHVQIWDDFVFAADDDRNKAQRLFKTLYRNRKIGPNRTREILDMLSGKTKTLQIEKDSDRGTYREMSMEEQ